MQNESITVLDLRTMPSQIKHPTVFETFDNLKVGESFIIRNDHNPIPLLMQIHSLREGEAKVDYMEQGPVWTLRFERMTDGKGGKIPGGCCGCCSHD